MKFWFRFVNSRSGSSRFRFSSVAMGRHERCESIFLPAPLAFPPVQKVSVDNSQSLTFQESGGAREKVKQWKTEVV